MDTAIVPVTPAPKGRDYYAILGVGRYATVEAINDAYNMWATLCHPDKEFYDPSMLPMSDLTQEEYWLLVNEGYEVLSNPVYRLTYNMVGEHGLKFYQDPPYRFSGDCMRIYEQFLASYYGVPPEMPATEGASVPSPIFITVPVTLEELFFGTIKTVLYRKNVGTSEDDTHVVTQSISLYIVAGTMHGSVLVKPRMGHIIGSSVGDAHFIIVQYKHPLFWVQEAHLYATIPLSLKAALLGGMFKLMSIDGKELTLLFDPAYSTSSVTTFYGEGMPILNTNRRGDLFIRYTVYLPTNIPEHIKHDLNHLLDQCA